ncbi:MAG: glutamate-semialdehyde -aminomutase [Thermomicrobiales bacterium]|nr:glutamate-semialdehyde -aminomutase [Thermomicrobiales bacterium]MEA2584805.1 glutamate-semialdehyde -aminomutase [Thermomicrobiales bacterium]MEA2595702.1 glutamate-semialdehyde -aminomutase [Thermomicrobiales bacterium]
MVDQVTPATTTRVTVEELVAQYVARNPRSRELFERAQASLPGGNTRTGLYMTPFPFYADRGEGKFLYDVDGHRLLDFVNNNTVLVQGHAHPEVVAAIVEQTARGTGFSRPTALEIELAEELQHRVPSLERVRFCNSGTEAALNAMRAARGFTGKAKIAKFEGAYHGTSDHALVSHVPPIGPELGPVDRPASVASSAGLGGATEEVVVLPFNNIAACEQIIAEHAADLAAVIVDPLMTGVGMTLPVDGFLSKLREVTARHDVLLIFDEIISLRVARGGAQSLYGVRPDLTAMAKIVAGGTPGGAFGGRADVMALFDPRPGARIPQAGTFNGNPVTMAAGLATLRLLTQEAYERLDALTARVADGLRAAFAAAGVTAQVTNVGSLFRVHFLPEPPRDYRAAAADDKRLHQALFFWLLNHDILWGLGGNLSLVMDEGDVDTLVTAVRSALEEVELPQRAV